MSQPQKYILLLIVSVFAGIVIVTQKTVSTKARQLKKNGVITSAMVTDCILLPKSGNSLNVKFTFLFQDSLYHSESLVMGIYLRDFRNKFIGKYFPVIYLANKPDNNEILITPDRFRRFGILFPDTLSWVRRFWEEEYKRLD